MTREIESVSCKSKIAELRLEPRELPDKLWDILTDQRFAARQPYLFYAEGHKYFGNIFNFLECKNGVLSCKRRLAVRQAVKTAEITAICKRNAQVAYCPVVSVE